MHPFSILTLGIFVAGYITARWDLIAQLYAVTIFAWEHGVVVSAFSHDDRITATNSSSLDSGCEGIRYSFDLLFPLPNTDRASCISGDETGEAHQKNWTASAAEGSTIASPFNKARHICTGTIASSRVILILTTMRSWSRMMACYESSGLMVSLSQPHPV
jgi:hypothetical protein